MKVYILTKGDYDEEGIFAVYARLEDAQEAAQQDCRVLLTWTQIDQLLCCTYSNGPRAPYVIDSWDVKGAES